MHRVKDPTGDAVKGVLNRNMIKWLGLGLLLCSADCMNGASAPFRNCLKQVTSFTGVNTQMATAVVSSSSRWAEAIARAALMFGRTAFSLGRFFFFGSLLNSLFFFHLFNLSIVLALALLFASIFRCLRSFRPKLFRSHATLESIFSCFTRQQSCFTASSNTKFTLAEHRCVTCRTLQVFALTP